MSKIKVNGIDVFFDVVPFPGSLLAPKRLPQFTCIFLFTNRQKDMGMALITLQLLICIIFILEIV